MKNQRIILSRDSLDRERGLATTPKMIGITPRLGKTYVTPPHLIEHNKMKVEAITRLEKQINKTESGELRNLLTDLNILLQYDKY